MRADDSFNQLTPFSTFGTMPRLRAFRRMLREHDLDFPVTIVHDGHRLGMIPVYVAPELSLVLRRDGSPLAVRLTPRPRGAEKPTVRMVRRALRRLRDQVPQLTDDVWNALPTVAHWDGQAYDFKVDDPSEYMDAEDDEFDLGMSTTSLDFRVWRPAPMAVQDVLDVLYPVPQRLPVRLAFDGHGGVGTPLAASVHAAGDGFRLLHLVPAAIRPDLPALETAAQLAAALSALPTLDIGGDERQYGFTVPVVVELDGCLYDIQCRKELLPQNRGLGLVVAPSRDILQACVDTSEATSSAQ